MTTLPSPIQTLTVGIGFTPIQRKTLADCFLTAGGDLHPALKTCIFLNTG